MRGLKSHNRTLQKTKEKVIITFFRVLVVVALLTAIWAQNNYVMTRKFVYSTEDLPKSFTGYRILHISDICNTSNNIVGHAKKAKPDIILLSGGYADKSGNCNRTVDVVNKLCNIAPVYYIYNTNDTTDCLSETSAVNVTDTSVDVGPCVSDATALVKKAYGDKIIKKANKGDEDAVQYLQYITDELKDENNPVLRVCGIDNMQGKSAKELQAKSYKITGSDDTGLTIMLNGNLANIDNLCARNVDIMCVGGTFGKSSDVASCSKGAYSDNGTQLFVSGGCGNLTDKRIANLPEMQLIILSDGTIKQTNPIESFLDMIIGDVGTIYDNDGGFTSYTYQYGAEEKQ